MTEWARVDSRLNEGKSLRTIETISVMRPWLWDTGAALGQVMAYSNTCGFPDLSWGQGVRTLAPLPARPELLSLGELIVEAVT